MQVQELSRPLAHDEEEKVKIFMEVRKVSRETALKFLFGRKFEVERAHILLNNYQRLILERHFQTVTVSDVLDELKTGLMYIPGTRDRNGAALFVIDAGKYEPGRFTADQLLRLAFYMGERVVESPKTQSIGVTIIVDMSEFQWKNFELGMQRQILDMFTNNIPCRVKNILLYRAPWWISTLVKVVGPFLKEKMRQRIQVCEQGTLQRYCEAGQLPKTLDGQFAFNFDEMIKTEIDRQGQASFRAERRLDASGQEITKATIIPTGSIIMVSPQTEALLQEERDQLLKAINLRLETLKHEVKDMREDIGGPKRNINALLSKRASRMSLDWVALHQAQQVVQPNAVERVRSSEEDTKEAIKARLQERIDRNRVPSPASTMTSPRSLATSPTAVADVAAEPEFEMIKMVPKVQASPNAALVEQKAILKAELEARIAKRIQTANETSIAKAKDELAASQVTNVQEEPVETKIPTPMMEPAKDEASLEAVEDAVSRRRTNRRRNKDASILPICEPVVEEIAETVAKDIPEKTEPDQDDLVDITSKQFTSTPINTDSLVIESVDTGKDQEEDKTEKEEASDAIQELTISPSLVSTARPIRRRRSGGRSTIELPSDTSISPVVSATANTPPMPARPEATKRVSEYDLMDALKIIAPPSPEPNKADPIVEEAADVVVPETEAGGAKDVLKSRRRNASRRSNRSFVMPPTEGLNLSSGQNP